MDYDHMREQNDDRNENALFTIAAASLYNVNQPDDGEHTA